MLNRFLSFDESLASDSRIAHKANIAKFSNHEVFEHIKCVTLNNQQCQPRLTLFSLNPDELHYYPFAVLISAVEVVILLIICLVEYMFLIQ